MTDLSTEHRDRFKRWQAAAISQFGYSLNLTLGLSVAALGYWFALLRGNDFWPDRLATTSMYVALWALGAGITLGLCCTVNRLYDFRWTAQRARRNPAAPSQDELRWHGTLTWWLFHLHLLSFVIGIAALGFAILRTFGGKLT